MADDAATWAWADRDSAATRRADERPVSLAVPERNPAGRRLPPSRVPAYGPPVPGTGPGPRPGGAVPRQQALRPSAVALPDSTWIARFFRERFARGFRKRPPVAVAAPAEPSAPVAPIKTETEVPAPDGTPSTRTTVGLGEQVKMTRSVASRWSADDGTISPGLAEGAGSVIWTAPPHPGTYGVRADPQSSGEAVQAEVTMRVIHPRSTRLVKWQDHDYPAQNAGSGFTARVYVEPLSVSFGETEIREGAAEGEADGFYADELNLLHPVGVWQEAGNSNDAVGDVVGIRPPGYPPPFSPGHFRWTIPQYFRARGSSSSGSPFDTSVHTTVMEADGTETTTKQGATRTRTPAPADQVPHARDKGGQPARADEPHGEDAPVGPTVS